ncbi:MAG: metal ABC transporter ATP-binding protein [Candidatus Marinimicrobia bacterium]|nr:metal ABC transporter ATP-binding protein [Candidatus Neomarinimicrobiota bacterium]MDD5583409.1 metal ABC transporter ATP-binding protein [Candidatus Neomarinimicrobiota bacterium]
MTQTHEKVIDVQNVSFWYNKRTIVLKNITFPIVKNDYLVIIGPNGGGKTTLLQLLAGLLKPKEGNIVYYPPSLKKRIGYVPQFSNYDKNVPLYVLDAIKLGNLKKYRFLGNRHEGIDEEFLALTKRLKLDMLLYKPINELSGGQLQRVLIARAIIGNPGILLFDEPTTSIDSESRQIFQSVIRELNKTIPIVMVTHDVSALAHDVKHIACINQELYIHNAGEVTEETLEKVYGCPVDLIAHGVPHRVLKSHSGPK